MINNNTVLSAIDTGLSLADNSITVYFASDGERVDFVDNHGDWSTYERAQIMAALATYAEVANLSFSITTDIDEATFKLTKSASEHGSLGFMNSPDPAYGDAQGVAWFNTYSYWGDNDSGLLDAGSYTSTIFLHEFGHGLGLTHPHDTGGGSTIIPDIGDGFGLDQGVYTVMSYHDGWPEAPSGSPTVREWGWNLGPSALDIAVIQLKYGVNPTTGTGNSTYTLQKQNAEGTGYRTIWDVDGYDVITHKGADAAVIDLRAASLLPEQDGGGYVSYVSGIHGGFTIAHGVTIEGASGGRGSDMIIGNSAANKLKGGGGSDVVKAGRGNDVLFGGKGSDLLQGQRGADRIIGGQGKDQLEGGKGADILLGGRGADNLFGGNSHDTLIGGRGADTLTGGAGKDVFVIRPQEGNDVITDFSTVDFLDLSAFNLASFDEVQLETTENGTRLEVADTEVMLLSISIDQINDAMFII